jgi:hypothetical protein
MPSLAQVKVPRAKTLSTSSCHVALVPKDWKEISLNTVLNTPTAKLQRPRDPGGRKEEKAVGNLEAFP